MADQTEQIVMLQPTEPDEIARLTLELNKSVTDMNKAVGRVNRIADQAERVIFYIQALFGGLFVVIFIFALFLLRR